MQEALRFDPTGCDFPPPRVPLLPRAAFALSAAGPVPAPAGRVFRHFARGRYALHEAFRLAGVGPGRALFAPAYHCRTMVDPALSLGAPVHLYPLDAGLEPDLVRVATLLARHGAPAALLATHFFGVARRFEALAAWCRQHGVVLVEDCAHGFVLDPADGHAGPAAGAMGGLGDYGVSSPYKFLPCPDGGLLWAPASRGQALRPPRGRSWRDELRGALGLRARAARALPGQGPGSPPDSGGACGQHLREPAHKPSPAYDIAAEGAGRLRLSRWLVRRAAVDAAAHTRRARHAQWQQASLRFRGARALHTPGEHDVPYMFALLLEQPEPAFSRLKRAGVPIWRWDEMLVSGCSTAGHYRERLLHLPCHQGLTEDEMDWMIACVEQVLRGCA